MRVAGQLLRVKPEHRPGQDQGHHDGDRGAVRVPVADRAAQGAAIIKPGMTVLCGIAGWVDRSLIDSKLFYPLAIKTSGDRLAFYSSQFSLVEVDSSYYGIPKREATEAWAAQTPDGFVFDVKSFSLFTNHPTRPMSLPPDIREDLPLELRSKNIYLEQMPEELLDECWE